MSAEILREAAALMRSRAEDATPGEWMIVPGASNVWHFPDEGVPILIASGNGLHGHHVTLRDAEHIASWHPAVALAVADWLDDLYERITDTDYDEDDDLAAALRGEVDVTDWPEVHRALAVATAYLGEAS